MSNQDLQDFIAHLISLLRERGSEAVEIFRTSVMTGQGGDLFIRVIPDGKRIAPEAWFRTEGFPA